MKMCREIVKERLTKVFTEKNLKGFKIDKAGFIYRCDEYSIILGRGCVAYIEYEHVVESYIDYEHVVADGRYYVEEIHIVDHLHGDDIVILGNGEVMSDDYFD